MHAALKTAGGIGGTHNPKLVASLQADTILFAMAGNAADTAADPPITINDMHRARVMLRDAILEIVAAERMRILNREPSRN